MEREKCSFCGKEKESLFSGGRKSVENKDAFICFDCVVKAKQQADASQEKIVVFNDGGAA